MGAAGSQLGALPLPVVPNLPFQTVCRLAGISGPEQQGSGVFSCEEAAGGREGCLEQGVIPCSNFFFFFKGKKEKQ